MSEIVLLGGVICDIPIFDSISLSLAKTGTYRVRDLGKDFLDKQINRFNKEYITGKGSGITLTNNEVKDIKKIIRSLENRGILLKGITKKLLVKKDDF